MLNLVLSGKHDVGAGVTEFIFIPDTGVTWQPGQSIKIDITKGYSTYERRFSLTSAPSSGEIRIATRESQSIFKQLLFNLEIGSYVAGGSINGDFLLDPKTVRPLLCAQGIGVTPYISMLRGCASARANPKLVLMLYSKSYEYPFSSELEYLRQQLGFQLDVVTESLLTAGEIARVASSVRADTIFLSGFSSLIYGLRNDLVAGGLDVERIKSDWFSGEESLMAN